jgi:hypothetical protein
MYATMAFFYFQIPFVKLVIYNLYLMQKLFLFLVACLLTASVYSQNHSDEIIIRSNFFGTQYLQNGKRLNFSQMAELMQPNAEAYRNIKSAKAGNTWVSIMSTAGGALIGYPIGTAIGGGDPNWTLAAVGAGIVAVAIPVSISVNKKAKKAVTLYNEGLKTTSLNSSIHMQLHITSSALGMYLNF